MTKLLSRWIKGPCPHEHTLIVRSTHVERTVCEECGYLSFTMRLGPVDSTDRELVGSNSR